jgi:hypothetical protein
MPPMKMAAAALVAVLLVLSSQHDARASSLYPQMACCSIISGATSGYAFCNIESTSEVDTCDSFSLYQYYFAMPVNQPAGPSESGVNENYQSPSPNPNGICVGSTWANPGSAPVPTMVNCTTLVLNGSEPVFTPNGQVTMTTQVSTGGPSTANKPPASANTVYFCAPPSGASCASGMFAVSSGSCCTAGTPFTNPNGLSWSGATITTPYTLSGPFVVASTPASTLHSVGLTASMLLRGSGGNRTADALDQPVRRSTSSGCGPTSRMASTTQSGRGPYTLRNAPSSVRRQRRASTRSIELS